MLDPLRYFTGAQISDFHWWWVKWRGVIHAVSAALVLAILIGGMCLTWSLAYDTGYRAAADEVAALCPTLLKLFAPGGSK